MPIQISLSNAIGALQGLAGGGPGPGPGPGYTPPLDDYTGATAAYSVRKLSSSYSGSCIEAYRVSDGVTQDIGFDSDGLIETAAIVAFASGSEVRVRTWYDQSGNTFDAVQTTPLQMPQIYDGSAVITENEKPAIQWNATNQTFLETAATDTWSDGSIYTSMVFDGRQGPPGSQTYWDIETGVQRYSSGALDMFAIFYGSVDVPRTSTAFSGQGLHTWYSVASETNAAIYIDGGLRGSTARTGNVGDQNVTACIGSRVGGSQWNSCKYQEIFHYGSDVVNYRTALESNINSYFQIGNLPDYTSGFLADYPNAAAAYSVRQLSNTAIKCMRVRRAVAPFDEKDIGFTAGGDLDEAAIVAFGGSDVLLVSAWYDQSGQSRHATQITPNSQPQIYDGSAVITENGKPAIDFQISRKVLSAGSVLDVSSRDIYQWSVYSLQTGAFWTPIINGPLYSATNQNTYQPRLYVQRTSSQPLGNSATALNIDQQYLRHDYADTSNARTFLDGDSSPVIDLVDNNSDWSTGVLEIGTIGTTPRTYQKVSEVLLWQTGAGTVPSNRTGIETDINTYYSIY